DGVCRDDSRRPAAGDQAGRALQGDRLHRRLGARASSRARLRRPHRHRRRSQKSLDARFAEADRGARMKSILIVRLGAFGDIVHALPAAAALRDAFPDARIDWLVDARYRAVLDLVPVLDHRIAVDSRAWSGAKAPFTVIRELRRARYEIAFDLQGLI